MFIFKIHEAKLQTQNLPENEGNHKLSAISSAMSITLVSDSFSAFFTPSVSMVLQNGQAAAMTCAPVAMASLVLSKFTLVVPFSSSLNICAPPAPQHNPELLQRFISISSASSASRTLRG